MSAWRRKMCLSWLRQGAGFSVGGEVLRLSYYHFSYPQQQAVLLETGQLPDGSGHSWGNHL